MTTMKNTDLLALKSYITAKDDTQYDSVGTGIVVLDLTHSNLVQRHIEIRFSLHATLDELRLKIHQKTGTPAQFQHLQVISGGNILTEIPPSSVNYKLGYFGLQHGMTVHCIDMNPHSGSKGGQYEDTSLVKKFTLSDKEYDERKGTLRDWGRQQKSKNANFTLAKHAREHRELVDAQRQAKLKLPLPQGFCKDATGRICRVEADIKSVTATTLAADDVPGITSVDGINVGMRCQVQPGGRRGEVAFVGEVKEIGGGGYWVGVMFDEPVGKTDGTAGTKRYFEAMPGFGGFVRGKNVQVGDYPERDILDELEDSDDEL